jgi:hypothetical protein
MIDIRQEAFNSISRVLAITRYDIEQRQLVNDLSLNIHGENYFRDVFNFIYGYELKNDNFRSQNSSCIDLVDNKKKLAIQITTTRTKEKLSNTLKALKDKKYKDYKIEIYYLLEKANPTKETIDEFKSIYEVELKDCLFDYTDLTRKINDLETHKLIQLNERYFKNNADKYTDEIILNLVFKHLLKNYNKVRPNYNDDFGTIDSRDKIILNNINNRIASKINTGLDYVSIVDDDESNILDDLRVLVVDNLYRNNLLKLLSTKLSSVEIENKNINELQQLSKLHSLDFNKIINNLHIDLEEKIEMKDYNSLSISWIIISFFFELCDIGVKE